MLKERAFTLSAEDFTVKNVRFLFYVVFYVEKFFKNTSWQVGGEVVEYIYRERSVSDRRIDESTKWIKDNIYWGRKAQER